MDGMNIGILTSGGDCPGLNAVIRAAVFKASKPRHGVRRLPRRLEGSRRRRHDALGRPQVMGISKQGGTILGTSRTNPFEAAAPSASRGDGADGVDALIAIGGEGTLAAAKRLTDAGIKIVGVPKTIDNDLSAPTTPSASTPRCRSRPRRWIACAPPATRMGAAWSPRSWAATSGWIALHSGMAAGAHAILIPEQKTSIDEICGWIDSARARPRAADRRRRGLQARHHGRRALRARTRRLRPPAAGRNRRPARPRDRAAHRHRDPLDHPGPHPAGRNPDRLRPRARHPLRHRGRRLGARGALGTHGRAERHAIVHVPFEDALGKLKTVPQYRYDEAAVLFG